MWKITHLFFYFDFSGEDENWRTELDSAFSGFYQRMPQSLICKIFGCYAYVVSKIKILWSKYLVTRNGQLCHISSRNNETIFFDLVLIYVAKKILDDICQNQRDSLHEVVKGNTTKTAQTTLLLFPSSDILT